MLRSLLKKVGGRKGKATRGGKGGSHVHTTQNKQAASKAIRDYEDCIHGKCTAARCTCAYLDDEY